MNYGGLVSLSFQTAYTPKQSPYVAAGNDVALIDHARKLATQARDPAPHYEHSELGYNYRMSNKEFYDSTNNRRLSENIHCTNI